MKSNKFILRLYAVLSILICGFILSSLHVLPYYYQSLPLLPFVMSLMCAITSIQVGHFKTSVVSLIIYSVTLIRYSIIPFLMTIGGQYTLVKQGIAQNAELAIFLLCYECIIIYIAVIVSFKKYYKSANEQKMIYLDNRISKYIILMSLFCIGMLVASPVLLKNYMTIFNLNQEEFTHAGRLDEMSVGSIVRILRTLYSLVFNLVRIMLPVYVIEICDKRIKSDFAMLLIVIFLVFTQFLMITATFAESIVSSLVILLSVSKLRHNLGKKIIRFAPYAVAGIIIVYFAVRYQVSQQSGVSSMSIGNNLAEYICAIVNAYFTGLDNVAASFNMSNEATLDHFLASMQITIPFNTTIFGKAAESVQSLYNLVNGTMGQISPTIGDGYYYFGPIFAPLFSYLFAYYGIKYGIKAVNTYSYWRHVCYYFISIVLALGLGMYNESITLAWINGWALPMFLVVWLSERKNRMLS